MSGLGICLDGGIPGGIPERTLGCCGDDFCTRSNEFNLSPVWGLAPLSACKKGSLAHQSDRKLRDLNRGTPFDWTIQTVES